MKTAGRKKSLTILVGAVFLGLAGCEVGVDGGLVQEVSAQAAAPAHAGTNAEPVAETPPAAAVASECDCGSGRVTGWSCNSQLCDDGDPCTDDVCANGACHSSPTFGECEAPQFVDWTSECAVDEDCQYGQSCVEVNGGDVGSAFVCQPQNVPKVQKQEAATQSGESCTLYFGGGEELYLPHQYSAGCVLPCLGERSVVCVQFKPGVAPSCDSDGDGDGVKSWVDCDDTDGAVGLECWPHEQPFFGCADHPKQYSYEAYPPEAFKK